MLPKPNINRKLILKLSIADKINWYCPMIKRSRLPEILGKINAKIDITPDRKTYQYSGSFVFATGEI